MSVEYEITATPVRRMPGYRHIAMTFAITPVGGVVERRMSVWMPYEAAEAWGLRWPAEGQQADLETTRLITRLGLTRLLELSRDGKEVPDNTSIGLRQYGDAKPRFPKQCAYLDRQRQEYSCKAAVKDDPWDGATTELLCESCQVPDRMVACSELTDVKTSWIPGDTQYGVRKVVQATCLAGNRLRAGAHCLPGVRRCWVCRFSVP